MILSSCCLNMSMLPSSRDALLATIHYHFPETSKLASSHPPKRPGLPPTPLRSCCVFWGRLFFRITEFDK